MARRILIPILMAVFGVLGLGSLSPAAAHTGLVSSDPRDGSALAAPPANVTFVFDEDLLPDFANFSVSNAAGEPITIVGIRVQAAVAILPWPADAPADSYTIAYRVVSQDGHPVSGSIQFSYVSESPTPVPTTSSASPTSSSATPSPGPTSATSSPQPTDSPAPGPTQTSSPTPSPAPSPDVDPVSASTSIGWVIAGAAVVILAVIAIITLVMRRR